MIFVAPKAQDLLLGHPGGSFRDRQHRDDGGYAEDNAQNGEARPQLVQEQALHPQSKRTPDASHRYLFSVSILH